MQGFHKHTRYQNNCWLCFTLDVEMKVADHLHFGHGDVHQLRLEDSVFAQNICNVKKVSLAWW